MLQKSTKWMQNLQSAEKEQAATLGAFRKQKLNPVVNMCFGFSFPSFLKLILYLKISPFGCDLLSEIHNF